MAARVSRFERGRFEFVLGGLVCLAPGFATAVGTSDAFAAFVANGF